MIKLRQASQKDFNYQYKLKKETLKEYIAKTWAWDEKWQKEYYSQNFKPELLKIITLSGKDIGCISIFEEKDHYFLSIIEILSKYQNQGIGTRLIKDLLSRSKKKIKRFIYKCLKQMKKHKDYINVLVFL